MSRRFDVLRPIALAAAVLADLPEGGSGSDAHPDAALLAACREYIGMQQRRDRLSAGGVAQAADDVGRSRAVEALAQGASAMLARVTEMRATSLDGHRARAAAFLAWDEGDLMGRADELCFPEDQILAAIVLDILHHPAG